MLDVLRDAGRRRGSRRWPTTCCRSSTRAAWWVSDVAPGQRPARRREQLGAAVRRGHRRARDRARRCPARPSTSTTSRRARRAIREAGSFCVELGGPGQRPGRGVGAGQRRLQRPARPPARRARRRGWLVEVYTDPISLPLARLRAGAARAGRAGGDRRRRATAAGRAAADAQRNPPRQSREKSVAAPLES